jgi:integrase
MKNKENLLTSEDLLARFIEEDGVSPRKRKRFRSDFRKVVEAIVHPASSEIRAVDLPRNRDELTSRSNGNLPAPSVSRYLQVIHWGIEQGLIPPSPTVAENLNFPNLARQEMSSEWRQAMSVYETALRIAGAKGTPFSKTNDKFWSKVFDSHSKSRISGRSDVTAFIRVWNREAEAGRVPEIDFPSLPSRKPAEYRLHEKDWPDTFDPSIAEIRQYYEDSIVKGRGRKKKMRSVSVNQQVSYLLRYGGYFFNEKGEDISTLGWDGLFSADRVLEYLFFTDPEAAERKNGYRYSSGKTQESILVAFIDLLRRPLGLAERASEIENLKKQFVFETKRPLIPEERNPDEIFGVAVSLAAKADELEGQGHLVRAAIHRRDSLIVALTMLWPRRIDMWHRLSLAKHVRREDESPIRICVWKEETKPNERDQVLEVPPELDGLFRHYLEIDRLRIIGSEKDDGFLFVAEGGQGAKRGTPRAAFRNRMKEYLGVSMGSHALRKIWSPRYLDWSGGDYLTVMAVMDTSLRNIINNYRDGQDRNQARDFVDNTNRLWNDLLNGGNQNESRH